MLTAELGRRTIVTGITINWFTPAEKAAARRRHAALRLMLCRPYDASARSDTKAASQEYAAAVRSARGAHRRQLERKYAHHSRRSPGSYDMHKSLERLTAAPRSQGIPSLRHPVSGATCTWGGVRGSSCTCTCADNTRGAHTSGSFTCGAGG